MHSFLAKTDIESAFRIIPVHPDYHCYLGMQWEGAIYYDTCLPMGLAESCRIFEELSTALDWAAYNKLGASAVVYVLVDFLFIEQTQARCELMLQDFKNMCNAAGIPLAREKTVGPAQEMQFLGITLDTIKMETRLPPDKLQHCQELLQSHCTKKLGPAMSLWIPRR